MAAYVKLVDRFPEIIGTLPRRISKDIKDGADAILEDARGRINTQSGELAASGEVKGGAGEYRVEFGAGQAYYARWIEFGRKNAPAYPFLYPAAESLAPEIVSKVTDTLRET